MSINKIQLILLCILSFITTSILQAETLTPGEHDKSLSLQALLKQVETGQQVDQQQHLERLHRFREAVEQQQDKLKQAVQEKDNAQLRSAALEKEFDRNNLKLEALHQELNEQLGTMKELFGVLQQAASQTRVSFQNSLTHLQFSERDNFLEQFSAQMGQATQLPSMANIEHFWFLIQQEMTASSEVLSFEAPVNKLSGEINKVLVTRIGSFNMVSEGQYLDYVPETGKLLELARQPAARYVDSLGSIDKVSSETPAMIAIDPTRGQLLAMLMQAPDLRERLDQAGLVGYLILLLGLLALLITLERFAVLNRLSAKIKKQLKSPDEPGDNPLGRILNCYQENRDADLETLELRVAETMMKDIPKIQSRIGLLKVIAVVSPLLGLLGTVTGMILTFQALTLFGTGDPRLMAGGISQALVTTVLGLAVAIPSMLLHSMVASKAKALTQVLEEQAIGIVAEQASQARTEAGAKVSTVLEQQ